MVCDPTRTDFTKRTLRHWHRADFYGRALRIGVLTAIFSSIALWSVWPMPRSIGSKVITSQEGIATVPLFNAWTIAWNAHSLRSGVQNYWHAPIFHPLQNSFALSEPQPAALVVAPVVWWWQSPIAAYNVYLLLSLVLNGLFTIRLMRTIGTGWIPSIVASVAMVQHPLLLLQADVVQLMPIWGILWTLTSLVRLREAVVESPIAAITDCSNAVGEANTNLTTLVSKRQGVLFRGLETGVAFGAVFATAVHHGLFLTLLLALTGILIVPWRQFWHWVPGALVALVVAAMLITPLAIPIIRVMKEHSFKRNEDVVAQLSTRAASFLVEPETALLKTHIVNREGLWHMSPGTIRMILAAVAVGLTMLSGFRRHLSICIFLVTFAGVALLLSLGVNLQPAGWKVWVTISQHMPGFSQVRNVFRFAYFFQIVVIVLASLGLSQLLELGNRWWAGRGCTKWIGHGMLVALASLIMFEVPPPTLRLSEVWKPRSEEWTEFVTSHLQHGNGVLIMPYAQGSSVGDFEVTSRWMVATVLDDIPMINGYSGFFPAAHFELQKLIQSHGLSGATLPFLSESKVQFVIAPAQSLPVWPRPLGHGFALVPVFSDSSGMQVLELRRE